MGQFTTAHISIDLNGELFDSQPKLKQEDQIKVIKDFLNNNGNQDGSLYPDSSIFEIEYSSGRQANAEWMSEELFKICKENGLPMQEFNTSLMVSSDGGKYWSIEDE